ncbi:hypothetical protein, conserved [Eimeria maxima]|uniref:Uncharacterized protein n=1 Tax=Eimeria maxima TaxID=5804 RepID=U6M2W8_EIMMA|nr:hypothetical protein, conserved [Eimeria maxima]CDJ56789.1 hypothetical protein, conserved [Eimeria maxima]
MARRWLAFVLCAVLAVIARAAEQPQQQLQEEQQQEQQQQQQEANKNEVITPNTTPEDIIVENPPPTQDPTSRPPTGTEEVGSPEQDKDQQQQQQENKDEHQQQDQQQQQQQQQQEEEEEEDHEEEEMILGALRFDTLYKYMSSLQKKFLLAVLPDSWAVPKFIPSNNVELEQVQQFLRQLAEEIGDPITSSSSSSSSSSGGGGGSAAALIELAESNRLPAVLQANPQLPSVLKELLAASMGPLGAPKDRFILSRQFSLPSLDLIDIEEIGRLFRVPTELEFPVSPDGLSLFIPVIIKKQDIQQKGDTNSLLASIENIFIPIVSHEGDILFSNAQTIFKGIELPTTLPFEPLATFSAYQMEDTSGLWAAVKGPVLSRLSVLGYEAETLFGPVLSLVSLPRVALSLNGETAAATAAAATTGGGGGEGRQQQASLDQIVAAASSQLKQTLITLKEIGGQKGDKKKGQIQQRRQQQLFAAETLEDFLNLKFLNFTLPVVGVPVELAPGVFTPLRSYSVCSNNDCPLGLSLPSFPDFLVSPDAAVSKLQQRVETLSYELQQAVQQLQQKINSSLPQGLASAADAQGVSVDGALSAALSLSGTLQRAVSIAGEKVQRLFGLQGPPTAAAAEPAAAAAAAAADASKPPAQGEEPAGLLASLYKRSTKDGEEGGLLAPRRRLQGGLIDLPVLGGRLSTIEYAGKGSIEDLLSLRELVAAVEGFVPSEGFAAVLQLSPELHGRTLGSLFEEKLLPQQLLQQPMSALLSSSSSSSIPSPLLQLSLGDFLSLSNSVNDFFKTPLLQVPSLQQLLDRARQSPLALYSNSSSSSSSNRGRSSSTSSSKNNNSLRQREPPIAATPGLFF